MRKRAIGVTFNHPSLTIAPIYLLLTPWLLVVVEHWFSGPTEHRMNVILFTGEKEQTKESKYESKHKVVRKEHMKGLNTSLLD